MLTDLLPCRVGPPLLRCHDLCSVATPNPPTNIIPTNIA